MMTGLTCFSLTKSLNFKSPQFDHGVRSNSCFVCGDFYLLFGVLDAGYIRQQ
jgi:hypothetical protein